MLSVPYWREGRGEQFCPRSNKIKMRYILPGVARAVMTAKCQHHAADAMKKGWPGYDMVVHEKSISGKYSEAKCREIALEKFGLEPEAPIRPANRKHCAGLSLDFSRVFS